MTNSETILSEVRLSFVWMETFCNLFFREDKTQTIRPKLGFLGNKLDYAKHFESIRDASDNSDLTLPWSKRGANRNHFWLHYLGNSDPQKTGGEEAWQYLLPFRTTIPVMVTSKDAKPFAVEGFYFPHGIALVATAYLDEELPFVQMVDQALQVRAPSTRYEMTWQNSKRTMRVSLDEMATLVLDNLRWDALGKAKPIGYPASRPFRINTVISGRGVKADDPSDKLVRQALEALCFWRENWQAAELADPNQFKIETHYASKGDLVYGQIYSRAIWLPRLFALPQKSPKLSCYHRNTTMLSMQTQSLIALARLATKYILYEDVMPASLENLARYAAGLLGRLYGAVDDTFKSWSAYRQIQDNRIQDIDDQFRQIDVVDQLREFYGLTPLKPGAKK